MLNANDLLIAIKKAALEAVEASQPSNFLFGKVTSVKPLKVLVEQKMTLGAAQLVLTRNVTNFTTKVSVDWKTENALADHTHDVKGTDSGNDLIDLTSENANLEHSHALKGVKQITIHNGLQIGDEVILLKQKGGQKYLVLDRVVNGA